MSDQTRPPLFSRQGDQLSKRPRESDLARHDIVRGCYYTNGHVQGRGNQCSICYDDITPDDETVTHCKCMNAYHEECFDSWVIRNTDLLAAEPQPSKCPMCNGVMRPWVIATVQISPAMEAARIEACRAAIEARETTAIVARMREADLLEPATLADLARRLGAEEDHALEREQALDQLRDFVVRVEVARVHGAPRDPGRSIAACDAAIRRVREEADAIIARAARNADIMEEDMNGRRRMGIPNNAELMDIMEARWNADIVAMDAIRLLLQRMLREREELNLGIRRRVSWAGQA